ncbi:MAG TPA: endonuclease/exonuclease/phosphatase family protein [Bryobacteraceae bacterium]|nr:endonuclease/exonuclease/phosphatase family protein [Bryobacteraceae bacterium]
MNSIRVATYNVHKCIGLDGRCRPDRIAEVIREIGPDVIGLQEVLSIESGVSADNQAQYLSDKLGMHLAVGEVRRLRGGSYGNIVLSRFPLRSSCVHDLTVEGREQRGCLRSDVLLPSSQLLHVFNVHLGTAFLERRHQARKLLEAELIRSRDLAGPRIVLGDFNEWTRGLVSRMLAAEFTGTDIRTHLGRSRTYPGVAPLMHLDHIYYDQDLVVQRALLHKSMKAVLGSDHLPLVVEFRMGSAPPAQVS